MRSILLFLSFGITQTVFSQNKNNLPDTISGYFKEIKIATNNQAKVWDKNLYGPILLVEPDPRKIYANFNDSAAVLKKNGNVYSGVLPKEQNIANTSIHWNGRDWAMILLPLSQNKHNRINLIAHELFHRAQPSLGFKLFTVDNNHLDKKNGRVYLRLELEALINAIQSKGKKDILRHLTNAFIFRKYRFDLYPGADTTENLLELNEGLAEYTGVLISNRKKPDIANHFVKSLDQFLRNPTFVKSFAYQTIPMYGYLLSTGKKYWNQEITIKTNLTDYFITSFNISIPSDLESIIKEISNTYHGQTIIAEEAAREEKIKKLIAEYKNKFIEQPHFDIRFEQMNISYDPRNIMPLEEYGTVYPNLRISDKWGILSVQNGALVSSPWDKVSITNPTKIDGKNISGNGWILQLNDGYLLSKDESNGSYKLLKK